jgi:hypothetical protein
MMFKLFKQPKITALIAFILTILFAIYLVYLFEVRLDNIPFRVISYQKSDNNRNVHQLPKTVYRDKCMQLFKKINTPNMSLFFRPPLNKPPDDMFDEFTQHGQMPITKYLYVNEVYADSKNDEKNTQKVITRAELDMYRDKVRRGEALGYNDKVLSELMGSYRQMLEAKTITVVGTQLPWVEAIALEVGASKITTLDYTHNKYEQAELLEWIHVSDYLANAITAQMIENFDNAVSFSSLEHAGLGRYGDPLNPNGDIEAVQQIHCMLKPGGLLFLGLPASHDGSSYIEFNAHRMYGKARLDRLLQGWKLLMKKKESAGFHDIFVLEKT